MEGNKKIVIGNKMMTRKELFEEEEKFRKEQAKLPFEEKIRALIDLQKVAYNWGKKKDVIVWRSEKKGTLIKRKQDKLSIFHIWPQ